MRIELVGEVGARDVLTREIPGASADAPPAANERIAIAALRHAASRICPCSRRMLISAVTTALTGMLDAEDVVSLLELCLEELIGAGDVIQEADAETGRRLIYLSPPMFVRSGPSTIYLVGGFPEADWPPVGRLSDHGPYRRLSPAPDDTVLSEHGIAEFPLEAWLEHPTIRQPEEVLAQLDEALGQAGSAGGLLDLQILDPQRRNNYYVGRWVTPRNHTGTFVAKRRRKYGADAWCYVEVVNGEPVRFVDLPYLDTRFRACDDAWWLICAMDVIAGHPQELRVVETAEKTVIAFNMPMPMWVDRRLTVFGQPADRPTGSLFAYILGSEDIGREMEFLKSSLWLSPTPSKVEC